MLISKQRWLSFFVTLFTFLGSHHNFINNPGLVVTFVTQRTSDVIIVYFYIVLPLCLVRGKGWKAFVRLGSDVSVPLRIRCSSLKDIKRLVQQMYFFSIS